MYGAIVGDVAGSAYEFCPTKDYNFEMFPTSLNGKYNSRFTDDSVLTAAVADVLMSDGDYIDTFHLYVKEEPKRGWGDSFANWAVTKSREPYGSWGNGSAMRVSPIAWFFDDLGSVLIEAAESAMVTHNDLFGVKGAQATAAAIFLARSEGFQKEQIKDYIQHVFGYNLSRSYDEIQPDYSFDVSCEGSVPEAIICFLESEDYEDCIRKAISLGGDADTQAAIAGSIAEAYYGGVPLYFLDKVLPILGDCRVSNIARTFHNEIVRKKMIEGKSS